MTDERTRDDRAQALRRALDRACLEHGEGVIGELGEKTLHATLKLFFEPNEDYHEIKIGAYYADIARDGQIIEVQTRSFDRLRKKIDCFLEAGYLVKIVYPVPAVKWISWIDREQGEVGKRRKSPRRGTVYDIVPELYKIRQWLSQENLEFHILLLEVTDYRNLDGYGKDKKTRSTRFERIPMTLLGECETGMFERFSSFVPDDLRENFRSGDFAAAAGISKGLAQKTLLILTDVHAVERVDRDKKGYIYKVSDR